MRPEQKDLVGRAVHLNFSAICGRLGGQCLTVCQVHPARHRTAHWLTGWGSRSETLPSPFGTDSSDLYSHSFAGSTHPLQTDPWFAPSGQAEKKQVVRLRPDQIGPGPIRGGQDGRSL